MIPSCTLKCERRTGLYTTIKLFLDPSEHPAYYLTMFGEGETTIIRSSSDINRDPNLKLVVGGGVVSLLIHGHRRVEPPHVLIQRREQTDWLDVSAASSHGADIVIELGHGDRFRTTAGEWTIEYQGVIGRSTPRVSPSSKRSMSLPLTLTLLPDNRAVDQRARPEVIENERLSSQPSDQIVTTPTYPLQQQSILGDCDSARAAFLKERLEYSILPNMFNLRRPTTRCSKLARNPFRHHNFLMSVKGNITMITQSPRGKEDNKKNEPAETGTGCSGKSHNFVSTALGTGDLSNVQICFSGNSKLAKDRDAIRSLKALGGQIVKSVEDATILCIKSDEPLSKTPKFLLAIAKGKDIVYDKWIVQSIKKKKMLPIEDYIPKDHVKEIEWGFDLRDAVARGKCGLDHILAGHSIHCTSSLHEALHSSFASYADLARALGAEDVKIGLPSRRARSTTLIIGCSNDRDSQTIANLEQRIWSKDLIPFTILRGRLQTDDESLLLGISVKEEKMDN